MLQGIAQLPQIAVAWRPAAADEVPLRAGGDATALALRLALFADRRPARSACRATRDARASRCNPARRAFTDAAKKSWFDMILLLPCLPELPVTGRRLLAFAFSGTFRVAS
jgi:hypothetical protein